MYKTNYSGNWNGLIFPYSQDQIKQFPRPDSVAIRPIKFLNKLPGEVSHDLSVMSYQSQTKIGKDL